MLNINFPANATFLTYAVSKIINLDILDPELIGNFLFQYSVEDKVMEHPDYEVTDEN